MAGLTLDAGALLAAERGDRALVVLIDAARRRHHVPVVPAVALAQAWRGGRQARLARFLRGCEIEPLDEQLARGAGALLGRTESTDAVDAVVAQSAAQRGDTVVTSDPGDLQVLADELRTIRVRAL